MLGLELLSLPGAEVVPRGHDVGAVGVSFGVQFDLLQHVEHFRRVAAATEHHEQVNGLALSANFGDRGIVRDR